MSVATVGVLASSRRRPTTLAGITTPFAMIHRGGGGNLAPDNSLGAMRYSLGRSTDAKMLDGGDLFQTTDGDWALMHDDTVDRTTNGTGAAATMSTATFRALTIDPQNSTPPIYGFADETPPPLLTEVLSEFGGRIPIQLELKDPTPALASSLITFLQGYSQLWPSLMVGCFIVDANGRAAAAAISAAGLTLEAISNLPSAASTAQVIATGCKHFSYNAGNFAASTAFLQTLADAGIKNAPYTLERRGDWQAESTRPGVTWVTSNEPWYILGSDRMRTTDQFAMGKYDDGLIPSSTSTARPKFTGSPARLSFETVNHQWCLQGYAGSPVPPASIEATITYDQPDSTTTFWAAIGFGCTTDADFQSATAGVNIGKGYLTLLRVNGMVGIYRLDTNGVSSTSLVTEVSTGATFTAGQSAVVKIEFLAGNVIKVTVTRGAVVTSIQATDSTYRGGYFHFGKRAAASGTQLKCSFSNVTVTS